MKALFTSFIYEPILNLFVGFYSFVGDAGIVILLITIIFQLILYPLNSKSIRAQKALTDLQPKLEKLKKEHKKDQQKLAQETMKLYKEHKVNPFGSCLPILIQIPIFLALFYVFQNVFNGFDVNQLYSFVPYPESIDPITLGIFDLSSRSIILALLAGIAQYVQVKMFSIQRPPRQAGEGGKDEDLAAMMNKQMLYVMPVLTVIIGFQFPAGVTLYWLLRTALAAGQQHILFSKDKKDKDTTSTPPDVIEGKVVS